MSDIISKGNTGMESIPALIADWRFARAYGAEDQELQIALELKLKRLGVKWCAHCGEPVKGYALTGGITMPMKCFHIEAGIR